MKKIVKFFYSQLNHKKNRCCCFYQWKISYGKYRNISIVLSVFIVHSECVISHYRALRVCYQSLSWTDSVLSVIIVHSECVISHYRAFTVCYQSFSCTHRVQQKQSNEMYSVAPTMPIFVLTRASVSNLRPAFIIHHTAKTLIKRIWIVFFY